MKMIGVCFRKLNVYINKCIFNQSLSLSLFLSLFLSFSLSFFLFLSLTHLFHHLLKAKSLFTTKTLKECKEALRKRFPFFVVNPHVTFLASKRRVIHSTVLFFFFTTNDKRLRTIAASHLSHNSIKISLWMRFATLSLARGAKHLATARNWFAADGVFWVYTWDTLWFRV